MATDFRLEERIASIRPIRLAPELELEVEGRRVAASLEPGRERGELYLLLDGRRERVFVASRHDAHYVHWRGRAHRVDAIDALDRVREQASRAGGAEEIRAPMPGVVVAVAVQAGDAVETGALLLTIESMKLQTAITATHPARIVEVCVVNGNHFDQGAPLVRLAAPESGGDAPIPQRDDAPSIRATDARTGTPRRAAATETAKSSAKTQSRAKANSKVKAKAATKSKAASKAGTRRKPKQKGRRA